MREAFGVPQNPGQGGWPTIRYFNQDTGYGGAPYEKKTSAAMCEELGNVDNMRAYVEDYGIKLCDVATGGEHCTGVHGADIFEICLSPSFTFYWSRVLQNFVNRPIPKRFTKRV